MGAWAYNRWLADFVGQHPGRHAGIAVITIHGPIGALGSVLAGPDDVTPESVIRRI